MTEVEPDYKILFDLEREDKLNLQKQNAELRAELEGIKARHEAILKELPADEEHCGCAVVMFEEVQRLKAKLEIPDVNFKKLVNNYVMTFATVSRKGGSVAECAELESRLHAEYNRVKLQRDEAQKGVAELEEFLQETEHRCPPPAFNWESWIQWENCNK